MYHQEPAKYINDLPKLPAADISTSAVACGNWLAQVRQIFAGLSPSAVDWWQAVELAANRHYQRWIVADPLDRLSLDPSGVIAIFDEVKYQRVESRAVSLILAAIPQHIRDEAVSNRWLSSAALLFRLQCVYQPGGASERSMLLSQLTLPEVVTTVKSAVVMLRKWQQNFYRVRELGASMPDPSLLLAGIDKATVGLLGQHHSLGFRVNAFRHKVALDYNPTVPSIVQLVRLLQAECEASALSNADAHVPDKKARAAAARGDNVVDPSTPKVAPPNKPEDTPNPPGIKALEGNEKGGKGKGKGKGKGLGSEQNPCHNFNEAKGCKFGDACHFKHDRATARKQKRCLACGQDGHFRPDCPLVAPENRQVVSPSSSNAPSPKAGAKGSGNPSRPKAGVQAKGVTEEPSNTSGGASSVSTSDDAARAQETLIAEAAKLLKGVTLKPVRIDQGEGALQEWGIDRGWLMSAVASASDPNYTLIDSGATNALRPSRADELESAQLIKVDLASGSSQLHVNRFGTLLSEQPCQIILPAGYLVQLGFSITWKKKGCIVKRRGQSALDVTIVKGCPLISKEQGLSLLAEYEALLDKGELPMVKTSSVTGHEAIPKDQLRPWLAKKVASGQLTRVDQLRWLASMFPEVPQEYLDQVAGSDVTPQGPSIEGVPWNRRKRRTIARAKPGDVLLHVFSGVQKWRGPGIALEVDKCLGADLLHGNVYQHLLSWATQGVFGGVVGGPPCRTISRCRSEADGGPPPVRDRGDGRWGLPGLTGDLVQLVREDSVLWLRFLFLHAVAQAAADGPPEPGLLPGLEGVIKNEVVVPPEISTPFELAKWALQQAAKNMQSPQNPCPKDVVLGRRVLFAWEHPRDPEEYVGSPPSQGSKQPSWWVFPEWEEFRKLYGLYLASFDQGCMGHCRPKPTSVGTSSWWLFETLHARFLTAEQRGMFGKPSSSLSQRLKDSPSWAAWAPGLIWAVKQAWSQWRIEQTKQPWIEERKAYLSKVTKSDLLERHINNDHIPYRKDCGVCVCGGPG